MPTHLTLPARNGRTRTATKNPAQELLRLAADATRTGLMPFETAEDLSQAILLLGRCNAQARHLIGCIEDPDIRSRLMSEADRIGALVEMAERKAAEF